VITAIRDISCPDPVPLIWKFLRYFLDQGSVARRIRAIHGLNETEQEANVKKQALQISYCIRQAEEYFTAALHVSIATKPLLLYYGAVALSQALILLRNDGDSSLDSLRKLKRHRHHGLELNELSLPRRETPGFLQEMLANIKCRVHKNEAGPCGHFVLFYRSLVPPVFSIPSKITEPGPNFIMHTKSPQMCAEMAPLDALTRRSINCFDLVKALPDCFYPLLELGLRPGLCRSDASQQSIRHFRTDPGGARTLNKVATETMIFIYDITVEQKSHLLSLYQSKGSKLTLASDFGSHIVLRLAYEEVPGQQVEQTYFPDLVDDVNGQLFCILEPDAYVNEAAAFLILLFCFGMLARYYPDLWMKALQVNVPFVEFVDSLLNTVQRKLPNLILDQMTGLKHFVHS